MSISQELHWYLKTNQWQWLNQHTSCMYSISQRNKPRTHKHTHTHTHTHIHTTRNESVRTNLQAKYGASCYASLRASDTKTDTRRIMRPNLMYCVYNDALSEELGQDALWLRDALQDALRLLAQVCPDGI